MLDAGAASRRSEVHRSDGNGSARLSLRPAPTAPGCRFPQATKISSERGRAPAYDGMIKASLERRHHVQRNDFTCKVMTSLTPGTNVEQPLAECDGEKQGREKEKGAPVQN